jgi:TRAP-type C4-dicarboxylate transport system permease small subunit
MAVVRFIDFVNKLVNVIIGLMVAVMSLTIFYQVISRYILSAPLPWSEELARYLMVYLTFLGAAVAMRHQRLISVQALPQLLPERPRKVLKLVVLSICLVFFVVLLLQGIAVSERVAYQSSAAMGLPMFVPYAAVPVGSAMLIMNTVAVILETLLLAEGED